ncbi:hypothetical protein B296_00007532 [Ensete ventricosum]|uniref:Uncharacterized protein n=1 Tax=Ensete ventricosum TaxID=4639 RepID=A0A427A1Q3_ENSVE|nr:hypothetical protein B296_00007532 [Ensete ventricosum]
MGDHSHVFLPTSLFLLLVLLSIAYPALVFQSSIYRSKGRWRARCSRAKRCSCMWVILASNTRVAAVGDGRLPRATGDCSEVVRVKELWQWWGSRDEERSVKLLLVLMTTQAQAANAKMWSTSVVDYLISSLN